MSTFAKFTRQNQMYEEKRFSACALHWNTFIQKEQQQK